MPCRMLLKSWAILGLAELLGAGQQSRFHPLALGDLLLQPAVGLFQLRHLVFQAAHQRFAVARQGRFGRGGGAAARARLGVSGQDGQDRRQEVLGLGGLGQVGLGAQLVAQLAVPGVGVGGRVEDERDVAQANVGHPLAAQGVAIHDRHQDVRDHQVGGSLAGHLQGLGPVRGREHFQTLASQQGLQEIEVLGVVVDDQDPLHGPGSGSRGRRWQRTCSTKRSGSMGFSRYPSKPAATALA